MAQRMIWGTPVETERRRRIFLSVWAYAREFMSTKIVSESEFDHTSRMINLELETGNEELDTWWKENFKIDGTDWIRAHPYKRELHITAIHLIQNRGIFMTSSEFPTEGASNVTVVRKELEKEQFPQEDAA